MKLRQEDLELAFSFLEEPDDYVVVEVPDLIEVLQSEQAISGLLNIRVKEVASYKNDPNLFELLLDGYTVRRDGLRFFTPIGSAIFVDAYDYDWPRQWCPEVLIYQVEDNPEYLLRHMGILNMNSWVEGEYI